MRCWKCKNEAIGICRFCGRGVCSDHVLTTLYISSTYTDSDGDLNCLAVKDVLHCGKCKPIPTPIKVSEKEISKANKILSKKF